MIEVNQIGDGDPLEFEVMVREASGESRHHVTMSKKTYERVIAGRYTPEGWLEAAFRFLLDREPKESILGRFDVTVKRLQPGWIEAGESHGAAWKAFFAKGYVGCHRLQSARDLIAELLPNGRSTGRPAPQRAQR